jgi:hypothetical protein
MDALILDLTKRPVRIIFTIISVITDRHVRECYERWCSRDGQQLVGDPDHQLHGYTSHAAEALTD